MDYAFANIGRSLLFFPFGGVCSSLIPSSRVVDRIQCSLIDLELSGCVATIREVVRRLSTRKDLGNQVPPLHMYAEASKITECAEMSRLLFGREQFQVSSLHESSVSAGGPIRTRAAHEERLKGTKIFRHGDAERPRRRHRCSLYCIVFELLDFPRWKMRGLATTASYVQATPRAGRARGTAATV